MAVLVLAQPLPFHESATQETRQTDCDQRRHAVLRITKMVEGPLFVVLKVEGRIVADWVSVLEKECLARLRKKQEVLLDLAGVTFVSDDGVKMLKRIETGKLQLINCSYLIQDLLNARTR